MTREISFRHKRSRTAIGIGLGACLLTSPAAARETAKPPSTARQLDAKPQSTLRSLELQRAFVCGSHIARAGVYTQPSNPHPKWSIDQITQAKSILVMLGLDTNVLPKVAANPSAADHIAILEGSGKITTQLQKKPDAVRHAYALGLAMGAAEAESDTGEPSRATVRLKLTEAQAEAKTPSMNLAPEDLGKIVSALDDKIPMQTIHDQIVGLTGQYSQ